MKKATTYIENGREFIICKVNEGSKRDGYWAFENGVDIINGILVKALNGIEGYHSASVKQTIAHVSNRVKVDALEEQGIDRWAATLHIIEGLPLEEANERAEKIHEWLAKDNAERSKR